MPLDTGDTLMVHLRMSGQLLLARQLAQIDVQRDLRHDLTLPSRIRSHQHERERVPERPGRHARTGHGGDTAASTYNA